MCMPPFPSLNAFRQLIKISQAGIAIRSITLENQTNLQKKITKGMFVRLYNSTCNWSFVNRNNFGKQHFIYAKQWSNGTM